jgi:ABC-type dipeptide/oligopeptide/nickel transport system permease component
VWRTSRRILRLITAAAILILALFLMAHVLGGDPVRAALGPTAPPEIVEARRQALHLNDPLPVQFARYLRQLSRCDLGVSITSGDAVSTLLAPRIANTLTLALAALGVVLLAVPAGAAVSILTGRGRRRWLSRVYGVGTAGFASAPEFLVAAALIFVFAVALRWVPVAGRSGWASYILPALALGLTPAAILARVAKVETDKVMAQPYITTALSKRLPLRHIYWRHVLPNTLVPILTILGTIASGLLGGAVLVENVFAWPGLGTELVAAIIVRDYPVIQAVGLLIGLGVLLVNTGVDVVVAMLDDAWAAG